MEAVAATAAPPVEQLAVRARVGERQAFVSLCAPHFEGVFDFVLRTVRDLGLAAEISRSIFAQAQEYEGPEDVKQWLYAVAQRDTLAVLRSRRRPSGIERREREALNFTAVDASRVTDASRVLFDKELVELVWDSAAALALEDYALLDLNLRQGLTAEALDESLRLEPGSVRMKLSSLCARLDGDVRAILLARRARRNCVALDVVLSDLGDPSNEFCGAVRGHIRQCTDCRERGHRFVSATEVFGALAVMPAPQGLRKELAKSAK